MYGIYTKRLIASRLQGCVVSVKLHPQEVLPKTWKTYDLTN